MVSFRDQTDFDELEFSTSDPNDFGTVLATVTISPIDGGEVDPVSVTYTLIIDRCKLDTIETTTIISDFDYTIGDGPIQIGPNLKNEFAECTTSFQLTQDGEEPGEYFEDIFEFNTSTGVLIINDNDV